MFHTLLLVAPGLLHLGQALDVQLDSAGRSKLRSGDPVLANGGFESGSNTDNYQYANVVSGWSKSGNTAFVKTGSTAMNSLPSYEGNYYLGLAGKGSGIYQDVSGHEIGQWYRVKFRAMYKPCTTSSATCTQSQAKLQMSVDSSEKMNEGVPSGVWKWYQASYKAPTADVEIKFYHDGPDEDYASVVFLDGISVKKVDMWDPANGNGAEVLIEKVTCTGYPTADGCTRGKYLSPGDYAADGSTDVSEANIASEDTAWVAIHDSAKGRWRFKSKSLNQQSPDDSGPTRDGPNWFLHSTYAGCEARNWQNAATGCFNVQQTAQGLVSLSNVGTECGSLFAVYAVGNN